MVSVTVAQCAGVFLSHSWYVRLYAPGATAAVTVIAPVAVFNTMPLAHVPTDATVAFAGVPASTAAAPFTRSLAATFAMGVDAVPATALPVSATGTMDAVTVTVSVVSAQFGGVFLSQS